MILFGLFCDGTPRKRATDCHEIADRWQIFGKILLSSDTSRGRSVCCRWIWLNVKHILKDPYVSLRIFRMTLMYFSAYGDNY